MPKTDSTATLPKPTKVAKARVLTAREKLPERYPELTFEMCFGSAKPDGNLGEGALTVTQGKFLLGWEEQSEKTDATHFLDMLGKPIFCKNNQFNRDAHRDDMLTLAWTILNRHWADSRNSAPGERRTFNGAAMSIGRSGQTISCQHRLGGLVFAGQIWANPDCIEGISPKQRAMIARNWPEEPSIETAIFFGVDESQATLTTVDLARVRTFADNAFQSGLFGKESRTERIRLCKQLDFAIRLLWDRTGEKDNAFSPRRTPAESDEFLQSHKTILECIKHVNSENVPRKGMQHTLSSYLSPGTFSALMYLFATSDPGTNGEAYYAAIKDGTASEKKLNWSRWDAAHSFIVQLNTCAAHAGNAADVKHPFDCVRLARRPTATGEWDGMYFTQGSIDASNGGTGAEKLATIIRAWNIYVTKPADLDGPGLTRWYKKHLNEETLKLSYKYDENKNPVLDMSQFPEIGGIDRAGKEEAAVEPVGNGEGEEGGETSATVDPEPPTPENLEKLKEQERNNRVKDAKAKERKRLLDEANKRAAERKGSKNGDGEKAAATPEDGGESDDQPVSAD